jgi:hypothetical protein
MSHTTSSRRTAAAIGATALLGVVLAAPAMATLDPGSGESAASTASTSSVGIDREREAGGFTFSRELSTLPQKATQPSASSIPGIDLSGVDREREAGGFTFSRELSTLPQETAKPPQSTVVLLEDNGVEYLQVGAGVLAGIALAAAGAVVISRRNHGGLTPA